MANLVIATLSRMIDQAIAWGAAGEMTNPCRSAPKYRTRRRERFLTDVEFRRLGQTLDEFEATGRISPHAAAALRLLMLTGCRRNEILTLRWEDVRLEAQELHLSDSKSGPRTVSLSPEAVQVLASIERLPDNPWVIPGTKPGARLSSLFEPWRKVRARAGLDDVRLHDLRHSFASARAGARREPAGDRQAPRPRPDPDHRPLHAPHTRRRQRRRNKSGRRNRRGHSADRAADSTARSSAAKRVRNPAWRTHRAGQHPRPRRSHPSAYN